MILKKISSVIKISLALFIISCSNSSDNELKLDTLDEPIAEAQESRSGFNLEYRYSVFVPLKIMNKRRNCGLRLDFNPQTIELNKEITFGKTGELSIEYYPLRGNSYGDGSASQIKILTYSTRHKEGNGKIVFEALEPKLDGKIKVKIIEAKMYGFYTKEESFGANGQLLNNIEDPNPEKILELKDYSFETTFKRSIFDQ
jgi:hypothetical protein